MTIDKCLMTRLRINWGVGGVFDLTAIHKNEGAQFLAVGIGLT